MKTSARNCLSGTVVEVELGAVNAEVHLRLVSGIILVAAVTKTAVEELDLAVGKPVLALIKAPQVIVMTDFSGYRLSARNQLAGTVAFVKMGAVNAEVDIELGGGELLVATVTHESVETLGLQQGCKATAVFKASAVLLAVKI